ncbi:MAG: DUF1820 family protein [Leptospirales bacterium]|jgi:hypothetical protein
MNKSLYRVIFVNQGKSYQIYARSVLQGKLLGFVEIEDLVFGENSKILVDPTEEALRAEFEDTKRIFIPMQSVVRIEELEKDSRPRPRIVALSEKAKPGPGGGETDSPSNVTPLVQRPPARE